MAWDSPLAPVSDLVAAVTEAVDGRPVEQLTVSTAVELRADDGPGGLTVRLGPPRQALETTVMPVLHRIRLVVEPS